MLSLALHFLATAVAVYLTVNIVPGVSLSGGFQTALLVALMWSVVVTAVRPILVILTLPISIVTLGLFYFVINAFLFWSMQLIVPGFTVDGFLPALLGSIALSVLTWLIVKILPE